MFRLMLDALAPPDLTKSAHFAAPGDVCLVGSAVCASGPWVEITVRALWRAATWRPVCGVQHAGPSTVSESSGQLNPLIMMLVWGRIILCAASLRLRGNSAGDGRR